MPLLDIEKAIKDADIGSRFRLVNIASQRSRELNDIEIGKIKRWLEKRRSHIYSKVTTTSLDEIIKKTITFRETNQEEIEKLNMEYEMEMASARAEAEAEIAQQPK